MRKFVKKILSFIFKKIAIRRITTFETPLRINFYSRFNNNTYLGKNTNFNGITIRGNGKVTIGDNFHSGKNILIINRYHKYNFADSIPYDSKISISKDIVIEDNVWVGDRVLILGGVTIGEGAIIQAGAVVVKSIPKYGIAGGNPATVFKQRDIQSYELLKMNKKFW